MTDSYRPRYSMSDGPQPMPASAREAMYYFKGNSTPPKAPRGFHSNLRPRQHDRYGPAMATSSRPLLRPRQDVSDQSLLLPTAKNKFRDIDELTDSDEDEMLESDEEILSMRPAKRMRTEAVESPGTGGTPKWSNPDPYTVLPPPPEGGGKRMDVVKYIRKAKLSNEGIQESIDPAANNADFISLDGGFDGLLLDAPRGLKADGLDHLGKRKRDQEDARPRQPKGYPNHEEAPVLREWKPSNLSEATPWLSESFLADSAAIALHKEVVDFYEWVRPKEYEATVRDDVLKRLSLMLNKTEAGVLKAFGSYAAGLYLPSSDMDLVFLQHGCYRPGLVQANGLPPAPSRTLLNKVAKRLRDSGFARPGTCQLIPFAKVPIIKFVDEQSGLRVDLSFNNDTGVIANETVQKWKSQHPAMPIIVSIIKQFLMIRGLNDVAIGGLGGFSVICLVTSLIQHLPGASSPTNLGQLLVEFFNLYGNVLDKETVALRLDPPAYLDKITYKPHLFNKEKVGRLTIIDPNRPENNVSGGTREIDTIFACFSAAYHALQAKLETFENRQPAGASFSFLQDLVGGNFVSYEKQRKLSRSLYYSLTGKEVALQPPPPPPPPPPDRSQPPPPPPPSAPSETAQSTSKVTTNERSASSALETAKTSKNTKTKKNVSGEYGAKGKRRAERLKAARPEIAHLVGESIKAAEALRIGGYVNMNDMCKDLDAALNPSKKQKRKQERRAERSI